MLCVPVDCYTIISNKSYTSFKKRFGYWGIVVNRYLLTASINIKSLMLCFISFAGLQDELFCMQYLSKLALLLFSSNRILPMISIMMSTIRSEGFGFMPTIFAEIGNEDTVEKLHQFLFQF